MELCSRAFMLLFTSGVLISGAQSLFQANNIVEKFLGDFKKHKDEVAVPYGDYMIYRDEDTDEIRRKPKPGLGAGRGIIGQPTIKLVQTIRIPKRKEPPKSFNDSQSLIDTKDKLTSDKVSNMEKQKIVEEVEESMQKMSTYISLIKERLYKLNHQAHAMHDEALSMNPTQVKTVDATHRDNIKNSSVLKAMVTQEINQNTTAIEVNQNKTLGPRNETIGNAIAEVTSETTIDPKEYFNYDALWAQFTTVAMNVSVELRPNLEPKSNISPILTSNQNLTGKSNPPGTLEVSLSPSSVSPVPINSSQLESINSTIPSVLNTTVFTEEKPNNATTFQEVMTSQKNPTDSTLSAEPEEGFLAALTRGKSKSKSVFSKIKSFFG